MTRRAGDYRCRSDQGWSVRGWPARRAAAWAASWRWAPVRFQRACPLRWFAAAHYSHSDSRS